MKSVINVGLLGLGTVGSGIVKVLEKNRAQIEGKIGAKMNIKWILDKDEDKLKALGVPSIKTTNDVDKVIKDPEVDVVVELIGGVEPARTWIKAAMDNGKHVVTANKALLAEHWEDIIAHAEKRKVEIYFEASVGGGIPIIQCLNEGLTANRIESIYGIINGTCNYILTRMTHENKSFKEALAEAQKKGFAEADPTLDVEGWDTAHKLAILAMLGFDMNVTLDKIHVEGISKISPLDIKYAGEEFDCEIKLLAIAKEVEDELELRVHPTLIPKEHLLSAVDNAFNGIYVTGDAVGPLMFYGLGAGQMPAASAVMSDMIFVARNIFLGIAGKTSGFRHGATSQRARRIKSMDQVRSRYYLRFTLLDNPGVFSVVSGILGEHNISISSLVQKERKKGDKVPVIITTYDCLEKDIKEALQKIDGLNVVKEKTVLIRMEKGE